MESSPLSCTSSIPKVDDEAHKEIYDQLREVVSTYPAVPTGTGRPYLRHPDGWYAYAPNVVNAMVIKQHLKARDTDVFLATFPKCGTTWLKALVFAALRRSTAGPAVAPLAAHSPHQLVPFLESQVFTNGRIPDLSSLPAPRLLMTHIPSVSLPECIFASGCKVVYLCRDPKDCFVSLWHFLNKFAPSPWDIGEAFAPFCDGVSLFGPFWEHALGYWRWQVERPEQLLFLTYEELAADTLGQLRRLTEFIGCPFTAEEQEAGMDREIVEACTMERLAGLEVNRSGKTQMTESSVANNIFFRRGVVGDWKNNLTLEMARRIDKITESKFRGSGLVLPSDLNSEVLN
uniref:Uncharacterized protein n=1 Tax=Avena sativa TaxID=4498 RepID=A0ACD6ABH7_AVESA